MKNLVLIIFLFAFTLVLARAQTATTQPVDTSIRLRGTDGKTYDIASMRGQVVLVSFGATWCEPCKEELKALEQLKKEYKDKPVTFLWVSVEGEEEVSNSGLKDYAKKLKLSFPILRDPDRSTFARFSARMRLPTVLYFDKNGKLSTPNQVGMATAQLYFSTVRGRLDKLLATE
jgi:thiol-disulfide isomerase/thioredoxin